MDLQRRAAFSQDGQGGNPAGVLISDQLPSVEDMQRIAAEVGYSETVFAAPQGDLWRTRYFAPEAEVPFCGHATIALGAALGEAYGAGTYRLALNDAEISVDALADGGAELTSPPTSYGPVSDPLLDGALALFGWDRSSLAEAISPAIGFAGSAKFLLLPLKHENDLRQMAYDQAEGAAVMQAGGFVTFNLFWHDEDGTVHSRNPFAGHGVYEDPATGASNAALAGYFRDAGFGAHPYDVLQGVDMGAPSRLRVTPLTGAGAPVKIAGQTRMIAQ